MTWRGRVWISFDCSWKSMPPMMHATLGADPPIERNWSAIWDASSRVGVRIKQNPGCGSSLQCWTIGIANVRVFPVPVGEFAITFSPERMAGIQAAWTPDGVVNPIQETNTLNKHRLLPNVTTGQLTQIFTTWDHEWTKSQCFESSVVHDFIDLSSSSGSDCFHREGQRRWHVMRDRANWRILFLYLCLNWARWSHGH